MQKLFTVYDAKSETYSAPSANPSRGQAARSFGDAVNTPHSVERPNVLNQHPEDFTLFEIGEFDLRTGVITLYDACFAVGNGLDFVEKA